MEKDVENWDHRRDVEKDETYGGMCEKCCDAGPVSCTTCFLRGSS